MNLHDAPTMSGCVICINTRLGAATYPSTPMLRVMERQAYFSSLRQQMSYRKSRSNVSVVSVNSIHDVLLTKLKVYTHLERGRLASMILVGAVGDLKENATKKVSATSHTVMSTATPTCTMAVKRRCDGGLGTGPLCTKGCLGGGVGAMDANLGARFRSMVTTTE